MKRFFYSMCGIFMAGLGVIVGTRMSVDAMAVIIGVVFGLIATIPTTLLLIYVLRQRDQQQATMHQQMGQYQYPPVVVVNSPAGSTPAGNGLLSQAMLPPAAERSFKVVGQDATPVETLTDAFNLSSIWDENN